MHQCQRWEAAESKVSKTQKSYSNFNAIYPDDEMNKKINYNSSLIHLPQKHNSLHCGGMVSVCANTDGSAFNSFSYISGQTKSGATNNWNFHHRQQCIKNRVNEKTLPSSDESKFEILFGKHSSSIET